MKCSECKILNNGCIRKEDLEVYHQLLDSFLVDKPCFPKSSHLRIKETKNDFIDESFNNE